MNKTTRFPVTRIALNAVCIAIYVILAMLLTIPMGPLKITVEALPVFICALVATPMDAALVAGLGEFLNQMLTYGLTPTTLLWMLPGIVRGLILGIGMLPIRKRAVFPSKNVNHMVVYFVLCMVGAVAVSLLNTFALYVDSKMFHYYSYNLVLGSLVLRIITGLVSTAVMAVAALPVATAIRKAGLARKLEQEIFKTEEAKKIQRRVLMRAFLWALVLEIPATVAVYFIGSIGAVPTTILHTGILCASYIISVNKETGR